MYCLTFKTVQLVRRVSLYTSRNLTSRCRQGSSKSVRQGVDVGGDTNHLEALSKPLGSLLTGQT